MRPSCADSELSPFARSRGPKSDGEAVKWMLKSTGVNLMESSSFGHPPKAAAPAVAGPSINLTVGTAAPTLCKKVLRVHSRLNSMYRLLRIDLHGRSVFRVMNR